MNVQGCHTRSQAADHSAQAWHRTLLQLLCMLLASTAARLVLMQQTQVQSTALFPVFAQRINPPINPSVDKPINQLHFVSSALIVGVCTQRFLTIVVRINDTV